MCAQILISIRAILVLTVLTGVAYPLVVTVIGQLAFPRQANGSLVVSDGKLVGSELLAQKFAGAGYFWPRPSAADYGTVASGASNQGYTSKKLLDAIAERRGLLGADAPADLLTASASGLDPDLSPEAARYQVVRVAAARGMAPAAVEEIVRAQLRAPQFGFLGQPTVNVLALNRALDAAPKP